MKIYTKKGDRGNTSLYDGQILSKDHEIFHLLGKIDECNVQIGRLRLFAIDIEIFIKIQRFLMNLSSHIATILPKNREKLPTINLTAEILEGFIDRWTSECPKLTNFILPGTCKEEIDAHQCRVTVREIERLFVLHLQSDGNIKENLKIFLPILNRLSDFFFAYARICTLRDHKIELIL